MVTSTRTAPVTTSREHRPRVVIAGGGVAAVEALLALGSQLGKLAHVELIAPQRDFVYQPLSVAEPFGLAETHLFPLADVVEGRASLRQGSIVGIDADARLVRLDDGAQAGYDELLVAVGARRLPWLEGALTFTGAEAGPAFRALVRELDEGAVDHLAFVVPPGVSWTLPLYDLALLTASHLADRHVTGVTLTVVTPEAAPLSLFGPAAADALRSLLGDRGITLRPSTYVERIDGGLLRLRPAGSIRADRVVTLPRLAGPRIPGLPADAEGFIRIDEHGRVAGVASVHAAGDGTDFPLKQGGLAAQQADAGEAATRSRSPTARSGGRRPRSPVVTWRRSLPSAERWRVPSSPTARQARPTPRRGSTTWSRSMPWCWPSPTMTPDEGTFAPRSPGSRRSSVCTACCRRIASSAVRGGGRGSRSALSDVASAGQVMGTDISTTVPGAPGAMSSVPSARATRSRIPASP